MGQIKLISKVSSLDTEAKNEIVGNIRIKTMIFKSPPRRIMYRTSNEKWGTKSASSDGHMTKGIGASDAYSVNSECDFSCKTQSNVEV